MRLALALVAPALLATGCVLPFCGPTEYFVGGVGLSGTFRDETWDPARAAAGVREAGFEPRNATERVVDGRAGNLSLYLNGAPGETISLTVGIEESRSGLRSREGADAAAKEILDAHRSRLDEIVVAFTRGSGWTLDTALAPESRVGHGDC